MLRPITSPLLMSLLLTMSTAHSQTITESRDDARGVSFVSVQFSSEEISDLQTLGGLFSSTDRVTLGVSGLVFDETPGAGEFVLWLRHDGGKRWFVGPAAQPLTIRLDDSRLIQPIAQFQPAPARARAARSNLTERLEFVLSPQDFADILAAERATIVITTVLGTIEKELTSSEQSTLGRLSRRLSES